MLFFKNPEFRANVFMVVVCVCCVNVLATVFFNIRFTKLNVKDQIKQKYKLID